jgi:hypothetical protein
MERDRITRFGARTPGAESNPTPRRCTKKKKKKVVGPTPSGTTELDYEVHEGQRQTKCPSANAGSRLKRWAHWEGPV